MIRMELHTHSTFCDGQDTPEAMARAALEKGINCLGFSPHGYAPYDPECCIKKETVPAYRAEILRLREAYRGKLRILIGVEQDCLMGAPEEQYDFVIGSSHYLLHEGEYLDVDGSVEHFQEAAERCFGGDYYAFARAYFAQLAAWIPRCKPDIIGHFDLFAKFNRGGAFFDEDDARYLRAWRPAADRLLALRKPFEINTGVILRGYRDVPYPAPPILAYLRSRGACFVLSGDAHSTEGIAFQFERWEAYAEKQGLFLLKNWK